MNINEIISQIASAGGIARPTLFRVDIVPPRVFSAPERRKENDIGKKYESEYFADRKGEPAQNYGIRNDYFEKLSIDNQEMPYRLNLMCQRAELPGASFSTSDVRTYGSTFKMPYVDTYSDINLDFICGHDMNEKYFFDAWRYTIQDPETADFNYVSEYATTLDIYQMDEYDQATYGVRFFQAWPVSVGGLHLAYENRNTYHILPVTFTYRKWINIVLETSTPSEIIAAGGTPQPFSDTIRKPAKKISSDGPCVVDPPKG